MLSSYSLRLLVVCLSTVVLATQWQASGNGGWFGSIVNDSAPNLPRLETVLIATVDDIYADQGNISLRQGAENISDTLNMLWDPAWNVAIGVTDTPYDNMVLYGYAFRNHWCWFNQYDGSELSIVVWKDYNCRTWINFDIYDQDLNATLPRHEAIAQFVQEGAEQTPVTNVWQATKFVVEATEMSEGYTETYSGVGFSGIPWEFVAHFCQGGIDGGFAIAQAYIFPDPDGGSGGCDCPCTCGGGGILPPLSEEELMVWLDANNMTFADIDGYIARNGLTDEEFEDQVRRESFLIQNQMTEAELQDLLAQMNMTWQEFYLYNYEQEFIGTHVSDEDYLLWLQSQNMTQSQIDAYMANHNQSLSDLERQIDHDVYAINHNLSNSEFDRWLFDRNITSLGFRQYAVFSFTTRVGNYIELPPLS